MTTVSEQDRAQKLTDSAMKMYFGPVDAWPNGLANWFYKAIATSLSDVRREERERAEHRPGVPAMPAQRLYNAVRALEDFDMLEEAAELKRRAGQED